MKLSSAFVLSAITVAALGESITTTITATKNGHVYTKTVTQDATFVWAGEGAAVTSAVTEASTVAATSAAAETSVAAETSIVEPSTSAQGTSADEGSGSSITTTITATKNGHVYTKTVTQDATFVWTGEGERAPASTVATVETSVAAETSVAEPSTSAQGTSADEGSGSSITTTITATKNGHVYTKTVTQDATFVWTGEGERAPVSTVATVETAASPVTSVAEPSASADEGSGSIVASTTTSSESSATIVTPTRIGQAYTESSSRDAQSVRTHESNNWSSSSSASTKMVSSITRVQTTTAGIFTNGKSSTTPQIVNYTGAADSIAAGTGLMGAALAAVIFL
ncbi:AMM_1a_G0047480.mRNA.1.CDS.1 [Saccharomyces cerevisiae]|nr:AVI_1a_G0013560.mRNA.1.CDS.1 [Saccharomyces cerevisiae]CAI4391167.1 ANE_G0013590.mRNA.1.CDS.1 [Saccharomyces cerevisiae]CAI4789751.1 AMM_1a_G0047480.mRNA.1.CDS.1 [Saccharomyces cerevisiae]CAI6592397.1 ANE_G0013590.mRNA.1.CDS.1 [Saccharomyces cerevisiae]CAI6893312.1 AMM_1a_G0047480.mRNA.1.CDS.1 [Saccharomyces cerevisiae]